jgi:competence protein ComEA
MIQNVIRGASRASVAVAAAAMLTVVASARQEAGKPAEGAEPAPPPPQFTKICAHCHESTRIVETRRLKPQWEEVIDKMVNEGATGSDAEFTVVLDYLMSEYGRVNVNAAEAAELAQVLHLERPLAQAIVDFRKAQGKFADFDALLKVPNVPADALRKRQEAIVF